MGWESGRVWLESDEIHCKSAICGDWSLPLSEVRVIGEFTNQDGPVDDYFFAFVTSPYEMWRSVSFYADGRDTFLRSLGVKLGIECECTLVASADFNSCVWWPPELAGQKMFEFRQEGLKHKILGGNNQYLAPAVRIFLGAEK